MARGPAERAEVSIPEPHFDDNQDQGKGVNILPTSDREDNDERQSQNFKEENPQQGIKGKNPRQVTKGNNLTEWDSDENIHYPELPASSPEDELSKSHDTGEGNLKSPPAIPKTLFPLLLFHPLFQDYKDNKSDLGYSSDNDNNMSHPPTLSLAKHLGSNLSKDAMIE